MASTRNNNTKSDYCLQQRQYARQFEYQEYAHSQHGQPYVPAITAGGSAPPSRMWRNNLSHNPIEIESTLFGIGSTNLVNPQPKVCPKLKYPPVLHFFERREVIMPEPLEVEPNQRAFPVPGR
jgi:hypothetical protein